MIIDIHTHAFPDYLAPKAMSILKKQGEGKLFACHDGTIQGLKENMIKWNITHSVLVPIVTKQSQTKSLNEWAKSQIEADDNKIIPFGSFFPHSDDYKRDIDFICELGLLGIKLHPEYQNFHLLDEKMIQAYEYALSKGLHIIFHAGEDDGLPPPYKSKPQDFAYLADLFDSQTRTNNNFGKIIVAHLGGYRQWNLVYKHLAGKNVYFDTCMGFNTLTGFSKEVFLKILERHGADKILFGSDSPWSVAYEELKTLDALPITEEEKSLIKGKNAAKLLNIHL